MMTDWMSLKITLVMKHKLDPKTSREFVDSGSMLLCGEHDNYLGGAPDAFLL